MQNVCESEMSGVGILDCGTLAEGEGGMLLELWVCFYLHFMYSNCDIYRHIHTHTHPLTHVPLLIVIDIHLFVSRCCCHTHTSHQHLTPTHTHLFLLLSARMNLIAQMCVKLYFCIRSCRRRSMNRSITSSSCCALWSYQLLLLWFLPAFQVGASWLSVL